MVGSIRSSVNVRTECINQAISLMDDNIIDQQLDKEQTQQVKAIFLNKNYNW